MRYKNNGNLLADEIIDALNSLNGWGSLEIYVQDHKVTQITKRSISKTNHRLNINSDEQEAKYQTTGGT